MSSHYARVAVADLTRDYRGNKVKVQGHVTDHADEADDDYHFNLTDEGGAMIRCEIIPELPFPCPHLGEQVRVRGIFRWDTDHGWPEIHPVTSLMYLGPK